MKPWILLALLCLCFALACGASLARSSPPAEEGVANDLAAALAPGQLIRLAFPDLPPTLFSMVRGIEGPEPAVSLRLPDDYAPDKTFPLLVYLGPNDGGVGTDISAPIEIVGKSGYVVATFPIFKRTCDRTVPWGIAPAMDDYPIMKQAYGEIMQRIRAKVPNIDYQRSIIGGYSNGANTLAVLLSALDETLLDSFSGFFFVDSGLEWSSYKRTNVLGGKHILYLVGGGEEHNPDWWREDFINRARWLKRCAEFMGMKNWRFEITPGVGHAFPNEYDAIIREWARQVGGTGKP